MREARLYERLDGEVVKCLVCERRCELAKSSRGVCKNYVNLDGKLMHVGYGILSAVESRPIEIKPLFHYWPNSTALTFSGYGCNFYCPWCQNNHLSFSDLPQDEPIIPAEKLVAKALKAGDEGLCASFNEPATLFDYLLDVFELGAEKGLYGTLVTNGYFTERAAKKLIESGADGFSVDIKGTPYAKTALTSIDHEKVFKFSKLVLDLGGHVEMVYLVVPGFNDSQESIEWILEKHLDYLGGDVPLHVNRYYPAHRWRKPSTPLQKLLTIREQATKLGIKFVYIGNVGVPEFEYTKCPACGKILIARLGYRVSYYNLDEENKCPRCGEKIPLRGRFVIK